MQGKTNQGLMQVRLALMKQAIPAALIEMLRALREFDRDELRTLFGEPVSKKDYANYNEHIKEPMDLKTLGSVIGPLTTFSLAAASLSPLCLS